MNTEQLKETLESCFLNITGEHPDNAIHKKYDAAILEFGKQCHNNAVKMCADTSNSLDAYESILKHLIP